MKIKKISIWIGILLLSALLITPGLSLGNVAQEPDLPAAKSTKILSTSQDQPLLEIQDIKGGIDVHAYIHNNGTANTTNVSWTIVFNGGIILFGRQSSDTIPGIDAGTGILISSGWVFGFGRSTATITVTCDEGASASANVTGTMIAFFFLGVK